MAIGKMRRACKRGLSIAIAAAVMATSAPQLSVTAMAQETGVTVQEETTDQAPAEVTEPADTEGGDSQDEDSAQDDSTNQDKTDSEDGTGDGADSNDSEEEKGDNVETPEEETDPADEEDGTKDEVSEEVVDNDGEDEKEQEKPEEKPVEAERKVYYASAQSEEEAVEGKTILSESFDSQTVGTEILIIYAENDSDKKYGKIAALAEDNLALECDVDLSGTTGWTEIFQPDVNVSSAYTTAITEELTLSYDVYFPHNENGGVEDFGTMKAKAALKTNGWSWVDGSKDFPEFEAKDLVQDEVDGYSKYHVVMKLNETNGWDLSKIESIEAAVPCLVGDTSTYKGKLYLDNVRLTDTSTSSGEEKPDNKDIVLYNSDFNSETADATLAKGTVKALADGNMAIEYSADLSASDGWTNMFQADSFSLNTPYDASKAEKMNLSYDVYFPDDSDTSTFGTVKAQAVLRNGGDWDWDQVSNLPAYTQADFVSGDVADYKKLHVSIDIKDGTYNNDAWELKDLTEIKAFTPCLAGDTSKYSGKMYLDNVVLTATPASSEDEKPVTKEDIIYESNFNDKTDASFVKAESGEAEPALAELADGNKAIKYTVDLSGTNGWATIFKAQIDLSEAYTKPISDKVVMSYDVYFPEASITENFKTIKAQAALKVGEHWTWVDQRSWPEITADTLTDSGIEGYKKFHVEIDMNDFQTYDNTTGQNVDYPFADITPIRTVIPCLGGDTSGYVGDVYLDNLVVKAVNESEGDIPVVEGICSWIWMHRHGQMRKDINTPVHRRSETRRSVIRNIW